MTHQASVRTSTLKAPPTYLDTVSLMIISPESTHTSPPTPNPPYGRPPVKAHRQLQCRVRKWNTLVESETIVKRNQPQSLGRVGLLNPFAMAVQFLRKMTSVGVHAHLVDYVGHSE